MPDYVNKLTSLFIIQFALIFLFLPKSHGDPVDPCPQLIYPLEKEKNIVTEKGGLWEIFERFPELRQYSADAIQLDSQLNEIIVIIHHLCITRDGIPLNELAVHIEKNLEGKSEEEFIDHMIRLGKNREDIDIWLKFYQFSKQSQNRTLPMEGVRTTISKAKNFIHQYVNISNEVEKQKHPDQVLTLIQSLTEIIDQFKINDTYFARGIEEFAQTPFWDIDENYGGS